MTIEETNHLLERLAQSEDPWVERKESFEEREVRKTLVGFANSVREGETAVLFLGARNDGNHPGLTNADDMQKKVAGVARKKCYPPIEFFPAVLTITFGSAVKEVLAVRVPFSGSRPHFSGSAFIRRGSETIEASREIFLDLIASQNDKARRILQFKDKRCWLRLKSKSGFWCDLECTVQFCDAHSVTLRDECGIQRSFPMPSIEVQKNSMRPLEIIASPTGTEEEHIRDIVRRWAQFRSPPAAGEYQLPSDWIVDQMLANPTLVLPSLAALADSSDNLWLRLLYLHVRFAKKRIENSKPRHQKIRLLEKRFHELLKGQAPFLNSGTIGAVVHSTVEVATSLAECDEFLRHLADRFPGVNSIPSVTLWSALTWELGL